ncbi:39S ribosomal protein L19, mitochondrial-like isoform X2 [Haliotis rubra]|uniref:39S ribosomal protein L19, mitochondrial-like isoform X1 n=1 Tax=Haliotis rubra TaxID=36100 RepID=UPI001EE53140|nr:39S ribosomal protein L19, mitochondrial-like isoform X1 [Haliotis rubra]XP_046571574.1 39S ribosomal protein L19, mitochondrial-like isoform X2 [Haliotis rubra]
MASLARKLRSLRLSVRTYDNFCKRSVVSGRNDIRVINYLDNEKVERHRRTPLSQHPDVKDIENVVGRRHVELPPDFSNVMPEFLPSPRVEHRDRVRELLEREDMYRRREQIEIPEFYVGSVLAVTVADKYTAGKTNRFVGICTRRNGHGLRACFILRNVVDGQGVEIMYEMYNPVVQKMEVLRLEKRLDEDLMYLRDCPPEYSTFPMDMEATPLPKGSSVSVNTMKVKLNPPPWHERWERMDLMGVEEFNVSEKRQRKAAAVAKPWEKYDLMKHYRESINEVESRTLMKEVFLRKQKIDQEWSSTKRVLRKR